MCVGVVNKFPMQEEINPAGIYIESVGQWRLLDL